MSEGLDPRMLLRGYAAGIFPMADSRDAGDIFWVEPRSRAIIPLDNFHMSHSLAKRVRSDRFTVTCDKAFHDVLLACGAMGVLAGLGALLAPDRGATVIATRTRR